VVCVCVSLACASGADLAPSPDYEGRPIEKVRFEPPSQPLPQEELERLVPFRQGTPLRLAEVRDAIKRLYATGRYDDLEVATEPEANGVVLVIRTKEQYFVGGVEVRGKVSLPPSESQLANASRLQLGN